MITTQEIELIWQQNLTNDQLLERKGMLDQLEEAVRIYMIDHDDIHGLGLFGSFLRGSFDPKSGSDIDFVVLKSGAELGLSQDEYSEIYGERHEAGDLPNQRFEVIAEHR